MSAAGIHQDRPVAGSSAAAASLQKALQQHRT